MRVCCKKNASSRTSSIKKHPQRLRVPSCASMIRLRQALSLYCTDAPGPSLDTEQALIPCSRDMPLSTCRRRRICRRCQHCTRRTDTTRHRRIFRHWLAVTHRCRCRIARCRRSHASNIRCGTTAACSSKASRRASVRDTRLVGRNACQQRIQRRLRTSLLPLLGPRPRLCTR
jgi:hypothetical protein